MEDFEKHQKFQLFSLKYWIFNWREFFYFIIVSLNHDYICLGIVLTRIYRKFYQMFKLSKWFKLDENEKHTKLFSFTRSLSILIIHMAHGQSLLFNKLLITQKLVKAHESLPGWCICNNIVFANCTLFY